MEMTPFTWMLILLAGVLLVMWLGTMSRLDRAERLLRWVEHNDIDGAVASEIRNYFED